MSTSTLNEYEWMNDKWSPVSRRSSAGQGKFADQRPTFYHCTTRPTLTNVDAGHVTCCVRGWVADQFLAATGSVVWSKTDAHFPNYGVNRGEMRVQSHPVSTVPRVCCLPPNTWSIRSKSAFVTYLYAGIFQLPQCTYTSTASRAMSRDTCHVNSQLP